MNEEKKKEKFKMKIKMKIVMISCLIEHQRKKTYIYILKKAFHSLTQIQIQTHTYTQWLKLA